MSLLRNLGSGLRSLFRKEQVNRELDEELGEYLRMSADEKMKQGISRKEALRAVRLERGSLEASKEIVRSGGWEFFVETCWHDLRFAARMLRKSPGFTCVAVLTLALGIGANSAIFSLIDAALLRSLPVRDPQRLVVFQWTAHKSPYLKGHYSYMSCPAKDEGASGEHGCWFSYPMFQQFHSTQEAFSTVAALCGNVGLNLRGNGPVTFVQGEMVSGDFFDTLGVGAAVGRTLVPSDDTPDASPVAVLSYGYWQSAFGGDPAAVGKTVWLNNVPVTIMGVAAKGFPSLDPGRVISLWIPLSVSPQIGLDLFGNVSGDHPSLKAGDDIWWVYVVARLKEGMSIEQAQAAANALFHNDVLDKSKEFFKTEDAPRLVLMPAPQAISGLREQFSTPLTILMTAVGMVLLVACANVAGLMLARSATRQRELAVRLALGAGRTRIACQLLTESLLLSLAGGASGILFAYWSVQSLVAFMSRGGVWPSHLTVHLDARVLVFTLAASILTGILFGLAPAFRGTRLDLTPALKDSTSALATGESRRRWLNLGSGLVIAQVALAILALSGAGLLVRTLENLKSVNPGFDTRNILLFRMEPALNGYTGERSKNLYSEMLARIEAIPGVLSASYSFDDLLSGNAWTTSFGIEGQARSTTLSTLGLQAGPKYFETMGIPLMTGRLFTSQDYSLPQDSQWQPAVINEAFARSFFKDQNPLGRHIAGVGHQGTSHEIVGIVGDTKFLNVRSEMAPTLFVPARGGEAVFEVRTAANPRTIIPAVRNIVSQLDSSLPLFSVRTETEQIDRSFFQERLIARASSFFGALSLLLACIGLYGLLSYEVSRKTREIGIRMALGARSSDVLRLIIRQGVELSAVGAALGILGALGSTRYLASLLYGVRPYDPVTFGAVALLLALVALAACYIPARRAMCVDPMVALRHE
ncbi:MAG TPA: ABC transporter permease [Verrucomicrobiae bacterium]|nr:ABC transporter permease [Verrucomicrobiae bacterium]